MSPVGMVSRRCVADRRPLTPGLYSDMHEVGEVARLTRLQHLVCDQRDLVLDALLDGQPVQVLEHRCHVVAPVGLRDDASESSERAAAS